ncbi:unnamed protein product [Ectocarpus sp. CCAP 1310/34]|nr:unnamed protein product [Ectocarpus sp. CCAP 1310/34]
MAQPAVVAAEDLEHSNEYGDEGFESDVPRSRPSRDGRESSEKCVEESVVLGLDTGLDDADLQTGSELAQGEQELNKTQAQRLVEGENAIDEEGKGVAYRNSQGGRTEGMDDREGSETGLKERDLPFRVSTDGDGDNDDGARENPSLDMNFDKAVFSPDDDRNFPPEKFLGRTGSVELSSNDLSSPQPFGAPEKEELHVGGEVQLEQQLPHKPHGDRCETRGREKERDIRGARSRNFNPKYRSQESDGRIRLRASSQSRANARGAASIRRQRQERLIQQLTRDNGVLQRKVAGYQLALQLSADEDDFSTSPSFSAAMQLQQAAPPAFPRGGGTPAPSPRVARGWTHRNPPPPGRISPVERNLSYTTLVRQLDMGGRQARTLKRENEALGARVNELESGAVLRATQSRLSERDEEIVALREELSVMNRLARAQDRKFEGCHGYALARRLWLTEEELRTARSTISTLGAEGQETKQQMADVKAEMLERALANMRKKARTVLDVAKGELEAARVEIDGLKEDKAVLTQALETKAREIRMQLLQAPKCSNPYVQLCPSNGMDSASANQNPMVPDAEQGLAFFRPQPHKPETRPPPLRVQVNRLKREIQHLSAGAIKLEEASCVVAAASFPLRARGISSAAAAAGETSALAVTKLHEGRAKSAVYSRPDAGGGGASMNLLDRSQPPPRPDRWLRSEREPWGARARLSGQFSPMGWNRVWGGDGAVTAPAADTGTPDAAGEATANGAPPAAAAVAGEVVSGALGRALSGLQADEAAKSADRGDGGVGVKLGSIKGKQEEVVAKPEKVEDIAAAAVGGEETHFHPCPLAGLMDMSDPPLRSHRRSYYNEDDGKVYSIPRTSDDVTAAELTEVPRDDERSMCVVDFQGIVRHGVGCALSQLAPRSARVSSATSRKQLLNSTSAAPGQDPDQERLLLPGENPLSIGISVRTWHRDSTSSWDPTGEGATGACHIAPT